MLNITSDHYIKEGNWSFIMFPAAPQFEMKFGKGFHSTEYQGRKSRTGKIGPKRRTLKGVINLKRGILLL